MNSESQKEITPRTLLGQNKGQLIVEYILLIFVVVVSCTLLTKLLVGRNSGNNGMVITKWGQLLEMVGEDLGD